MIDITSEFKRLAAIPNASIYMSAFNSSWDIDNPIRWRVSYANRNDSGTKIEIDRQGHTLEEAFQSVLDEIKRLENSGVRDIVSPPLLGHVVDAEAEEV